ncbi:MAG: hypothetical protein IT245_08760 [Bacteroidia bacterium]|nr:hypothetical protein [Bacteroidia bacterium]
MLDNITEWQNTVERVKEQLTSNQKTYLKLAKVCGVLGLVFMIAYWPIGAFLLLLTGIFYRFTIVKEILFIYRFNIIDKYIWAVPMSNNDSEGNDSNEEKFLYQYVIIPESVYKLEWPNKRFLPDKLKNIKLHQEAYDKTTIGDEMEVLISSEQNLYAYRFKKEMCFIMQNISIIDHKYQDTFIDQRLAQYGYKV